MYNSSFKIFSPKEPPPPPPPEKPWPETSGENILHLEEATFKESLKKRKHVLVMFYAPCKFVYFLFKNLFLDLDLSMLLRQFPLISKIMEIMRKFTGFCNSDTGNIS